MREISRVLFAPLPIMLAGFIMALVGILCALVFVIQKPWIGITFQFTDTHHALAVKAIENPALKSKLMVGDVVVGLSLDGIDRVHSLTGFRPGVEPPSFSSYAGHNAYVQAEGEVSAYLLGSLVNLHLLDGSMVPAILSDSRPVTSLPVDFWLFNSFGLLAFIIGLGVFAVRPKELAARWLGLSGSGFFIATLFNSVYLSRELAWPADQLLLLSRMNNIGLGVMLISLLALMTSFPRRLSVVSNPLMIIVVAVLYQVNEWMQWYEWPLHAYYMPIFILYILGVVVAIYQWRLSLRNPIDRAALKWMLLTIFIIMGMGLAIYFVPIAIIGRAIFPQWAMVGIASLLYIGFAFGIVRYRLFDVQRWWLNIWGWFLGGLSIVLLDVLFISFLNLQPVMALGIAAILVGWVYFPARQWILQRLSYQHGAEQYQLFEQVERMAQAISTRDTNAQWQAILVEQFAPAGVKVSSNGSDLVQMNQHGAVLSVPLLQGDGILELTYPSQGRRLFSSEDRVYVQNLLQVSRRIVRVHEGEFQAVRLERQRIVRDMHDDVGGHLLTLLRQAPSEHYEQLVRTAFGSLREAMQAMDEESSRVLLDCLDDWKEQLESRARMSGVSLVWQQAVSADDKLLSVRQAINISRILNESVTNALQHANPTTITVTIESSEDFLSLKVINNGITTGHDKREPTRGRGLNNMLTRAKELEGELKFSIQGDKASIAAIFPILR
ncbi:histidine kinase [Salinispirillum sp. LH 10-3-1]|uniref:histidine kinase n=1 Tax=Salinispirillum sp. LH 10-3-1 TaxID=2952525 RepID=A0AB38YHY4_9GAMM